MAGALMDPTRAPLAFGRRAVPQLFEQLQRPETGTRLRALASLCDLIHDPERLYQTVKGGFLERLKVLLKDEDPSVRARTCELLHLLTAHSVGRYSTNTAFISLSKRCCLFNCVRGAEALLTLVPKLMLKLRDDEDEEEEEEEEVQVLLLSTISCCSRLDALPALASDGVSLLGHKLLHRSPNIRREAAAAMMALSIPEDGKRQVCKEAVLPVLVGLLQDEDMEVQANAAGVIMYTVIITTGKQQCLDLDVVPVLLALVKALILYSLRTLTSLAEAPDGRRLLLEQLPLLLRRSEAAEEDRDIRRAAQTAVRVVTWTP
uniref:Radial spoke head 14 homolog n=1 Tax=Seriola lalandi dorsalis TaxID=1841481 RepID=A0A3B4WR37_SERLL